MSLFDKLLGKKPAKKELIIIHDDICDLTLDPNKSFPQFEGVVSWCGTECEVWLEPDDTERYSAEGSLTVLHKLMESPEDWDRRLREYSAEQKVKSDGMVEIWGSPDQLQDVVPPITKDEYISRMRINFISISANGDIYFDYDLDDMFTDHGEGINANISGEIYSAGLQG